MENKGGKKVENNKSDQFTPGGEMMACILREHTKHATYVHPT
jgi:hypothetical protein